ncbi:MAG TPA: hypothetical protein VKS79_12640 [Gemmataceae bacterium]|nr:hypothetical protein [Gemmataceae bacterium]
MPRRASILVLALLLTGCFARGFDHPSVYTHLQPDPISNMDEEIVKVGLLRPQLTFPCRIAVYLPPSVNGQWTSKEKDFVEAWATSLKTEGIAADMFLMSDLFTNGNTGDTSKGPTLKDLRVAAAKHGANALLVIQGECEVASYQNPAAVLNLTVVGGYLVPGSHRDALVTLQGALVDVSNGFLYTSVESQGDGKIIRPTFIVQDKPAIDKAKLKALENFGPELLKRMRNVYASFGPASAPVVHANHMQK